MKNIVLRRILVIVFVVVAACALAFYCVLMVNKRKNTLSENVFDLGVRESETTYDDVILKSYDELMELSNKYNITSSLKKDDFDDNYYLASFVDYDSCGEKKFKTVEDISYSDVIQVTYRVYNKCGFCKNHVALHLLKIDKVYLDIVEYTFIYDNENLECQV